MALDSSGFENDGMTKPSPSKVFRCAIYTRVSTDAGLDQEFNSLDAQREAGEAYIKSQAHEGWKLLPSLYDDGGFSGGSLERPALQQLLTDVKAGVIDIIVVYKVDRLTRSLADFAKLVELFDANQASFVSVTQAFNTTNSMGRLTLTVLLSFAQFEREVTAERIRDKVKASKKNGLWMGGAVPLGYRVADRKLLAVEDEAVTVRNIFTRYLALGSIIQLMAELRQQGVTTRVRHLSNGRTIGGVPFTAGPLLYLLKNRTYVGEINHRGEIYAGEHQGILDRSLFDAVQARLAANLVAGHTAGSSETLLLGRIIDDRGNIMTPTHSQKGSRRYYYYVSRAFIEGRRDEVGSISRVAASDIEPKVLTALRQVVQLIETSTIAGQDDRSLVQRSLERVTIRNDGIRIELKQDVCSSSQRIMDIPWKRKPKRPRREILFAADDATDGRPIKAKARKSLVKAIALGRTWLQELVAGKSADIKAIAAREGRSERSVQMTLSLAFLAPDIVEAAVMGTLPRGLGVTRLFDMPPTWTTQRQVLSN